MDIMLKDGASALPIIDALMEAVAASPWELSGCYFNTEAGIFLLPETRRAPGGIIRILGVRRKEKREWCGNHPGPCNGRIQSRVKSSRYMEGGEWVRFNDMVNDVLDSFGVDADVFSFAKMKYENRLWIRHGRRRRINYDGAFNGHHLDWDLPGDYSSDFADCIGNKTPVRASMPNGTPGSYEEMELLAG